MKRQAASERKRETKNSNKRTNESHWNLKNNDINTFVSYFVEHNALERIQVVHFSVVNEMQMTLFAGMHKPFNHMIFFEQVCSIHIDSGTFSASIFECSKMRTNAIQCNAIRCNVMQCNVRCWNSLTLTVLCATHWRQSNAPRIEWHSKNSKNYIVAIVVVFGWILMDFCIMECRTETKSVACKWWIPAHTMNERADCTLLLSKR